MKIAFTICSNNYFSQAKILISSLFDYNPEYRFILGLVDKKSASIDYDFDERVEVILIEELEIDNYYQIFEKFNIIELNTCVKASFFKLIKQRYPEVSLIIYFDPDIAIFSNLTEIEKMAETHSMLLTPHILTPINLDDFVPSENIFLNYGIYNLGFIALAFWDLEVNEMLNWWEQRTLNLGFDLVTKGIFVDQLWMNLVPIYYKNVKICDHFGMNMGPWNLHERTITMESEGYFKVNNSQNLIFYHFSSYNFKHPELLGKKYYSRYSFKNHPDLIPLYSWYQGRLIENNIVELSQIKCKYTPELTVKPPTLETRIKVFLAKLIPPLFWEIRKRPFENSN